MTRTANSLPKNRTQLRAAAIALAVGLLSRICVADGNPVRIVAVDPHAVASQPRVPVEDDRAMKVLDHQGAGVRGHLAFASQDKKLTVDVSEYEPITLKLENWPVDEFMYIIEGRVEITDAHGNGKIYGRGDAFVMPRGFTGTWRQLGAIRKIAVAYSTDRPDR